jgi:DUF4097 and DUF4098 domain-containing protein YvlB
MAEPSREKTEPKMKKVVVIVLLVFALLCVLAGIGGTIFFAANTGLRVNNAFDRRNISSVLGEEETLEVGTGKPVTLIVTDDAGDVTVTGADVDTVQVRVVKTAYDSSQARADQEVQGIEYTIQQDGNTITLKYELPSSMNFSNNVNTVDFVVTVPNEVTVSVTTVGEVSISDTTGTIKIQSGFGDVTLANIQGALDVGTKSGPIHASSVDSGSGNIVLMTGFGSISLENATGKDITLTSDSGGLELDNIRASGEVDLSTGFGDTQFNNGSANLLTIDTKSGQIAVSKLNVQKALTVLSGFGEIHIDQVNAASYDLTNGSGSITVAGARGSVRASSDFGPITITEADQATIDLSTKSGSVDFEGSLGAGPHSIHTGFGEVHLTLPADSELNVELKTGFGSIYSEIPIAVTGTIGGNKAESFETGTMNGGGEQLRVETNSGSITITASK